MLESSSLVEQWQESLEKFLEIDEELPTYKTKTGRLKTRKNIIGRLQGAHDSMTGIIDIAMVGSLCKKGEYHDLLNQYGLVICDECHHAASDTISNVLKEVKAKYVYGVTATPKRADSLEKINYMLIGLYDIVTQQRKWLLHREWNTMYIQDLPVQLHQEVLLRIKCIPMRHMI